MNKKTLKFITFVIILFTISYNLKAQNVIIEGTIKDSISKKSKS